MLALGNALLNLVRQTAGVGQAGPLSVALSRGPRRWHIARIVVFAFDLTEASQIRRISALRRLGHFVETVSFRRGNMNAGFEPDWPNLDLGFVPNQSFGKRLVRLLGALPAVLSHRSSICAADIVVARNFDLLALACVALGPRRKRSPKLIYECLDIHGLFTRQDSTGRIMRALERTALSRVDLLWTSSPGFVRNYFGPVQQYSGPVALLENKLWFENPFPARPTARVDPPKDRPFILGWVGSIRCAASLAVLSETARRLGPSVQIRVHGNIHRHAVPDFDGFVQQHANVTYHGAYQYPDDLADIYLNCDAVWAQDLWQRGSNSDWLLPNRIYEAGWFGCPCIAVDGTETGRRVMEDGGGFVVPVATGEALANLLAQLDRKTLAETSRRLLCRPDTEFRLTEEDIVSALTAVESPATSDSARPRPSAPVQDLGL